MAQTTTRDAAVGGGPLWGAARRVGAGGLREGDFPMSVATTGPTWKQALYGRSEGERTREPSRMTKKVLARTHPGAYTPADD